MYGRQSTIMEACLLKVDVHHVVSEGGHFRSFLPLPKTDFGDKLKQYDGLSRYYQILEHNNESPTIYG